MGWAGGWGEGGGRGWPCLWALVIKLLTRQQQQQQWSPIPVQIEISIAESRKINLKLSPTRPQHPQCSDEIFDYSRIKFSPCSTTNTRLHTFLNATLMLSACWCSVSLWTQVVIPRQSPYRRFSLKKKNKTKQNKKQLLLSQAAMDLHEYDVSKRAHGAGIAQLVVLGLAVHSVAGSILLWGLLPVEGIFPLELTWVQTPFAPKLLRMRV